MEMNNFTSKAWQDAKLILSFFKKNTDCMDGDKLTFCPKYVVCIDDDMVSAFYAAKVYRICWKQFGIAPKVICAGGIGMLSKYLNRDEHGNIMSEGKKLAGICEQLLVRSDDIQILDKGNNTGTVLKEIIDYTNNDKDAIIFCTTQRLSLRLERTVDFSTVQFPGTPRLNAFFYAPSESLNNMLQLYNAKGIADGLPLLSEVAALYDRFDKYCGKFMSDFKITDDIHKAGKSLVKHYPVRVSRLPISAPIQFWKMYRGVIDNREIIAEDLAFKIKLWQKAVKVI